MICSEIRALAGEVIFSDGGSKLGRVSRIRARELGFVDFSFSTIRLNMELDCVSPISDIGIALYTTLD